MLEDTTEKRINPSAPASDRLGAEFETHHLNLAARSQIAGLTEEASPAAGDLVLIENASGLLEYADVGNLPGGGGSSLPVVDTTAIVKDPVDATKLMRIDVGAVSTGTTRVLSMGDADFDLAVSVTAASASAVANTVQVSAGVDRTIKDAATLNIFGAAALGTDVDLQVQNTGGTGDLTWRKTNSRWEFANPVQLTGHIVDSSANEILKLVGVASALNEVTVTSGAAGNPALVTATGETNAELKLAASGGGTVIFGSEIDVLTNAINSSTSDVKFECGGTPVMRCETVNNTVMIGARTVSIDPRWFLHVSRSNDPCFAIVEVASDTGSEQPGFQFQKARGTIPGGETNIVTNDKCGGFFWLQYSGGYTNTASVRTVATGSGTCEMILAAGANVAYMTLQNGGNITQEVSGTNYYYGGTADHYIGHDASTGLEIGLPTGKTLRGYVNSVQEWELGANAMSFGAAGAFEGQIDWSTADTLIFKSITTERFRINQTGVSFNARTPIARPGYTITNPATRRSIDVSAITHAQLAEVVGTLLQDNIDYGLYQAV
ncbi:MAG: hypothetical protein ACYTG0_39155 [Planctomycetota bacterium]|jgi:hypothetical protein